MNKLELEKMFDEKDLIYSSQQIMEIKNFIFDTIIPEVLKDIIKYYGDYNDGCGCCSNTLLSDKLEKDVKEFYNITL